MCGPQCRTVLVMSMLAASVREAVSANDLSVGNEPCCQGACAVAGEEKYWSIAAGILGTKHCGECCMDPSKYKLYHFFEKNLTHSASASRVRALATPSTTLRLRTALVQLR